jgi:hypothetical protein
VSFGHPGFSGPPVDLVPVRVEPDEVEREVARQPVLGCDVEHSSYLTQHGFAAVLVLVAFYDHNSVELVDCEIQPSELLRSLPTKWDHGFTIGGVTDGGKILVQPFFPLFPSLVCSLSVVPFEVLLQVVGLDVAGLTSLHPAHERTVVVVNHRVSRKVVLP